ncbi:chromate transporter-domain-containing protein [Ilyonectria robusta]|uniref:chromate transporter-domain-containing protein n=1 Tax=Ilyonectria robusta TaxID=1079257 RepID=UPI001E8E4C55|nr:chromate transporter-domain-containing protein [Ilyonectria robusta]KAH8656301.1 chromate transporter-domain-containing protein [Ilyonectria robusta]
MTNQGLAPTSSRPIEAGSNPDDVEKSASMNPPSMAPTPPTSASIGDELGLEDNPTSRDFAQIALIKDRLVIQDKWISLPRFQRVFSVYQILPGPEAAELCMFFGCLSAGRIGGILAGIAFMLPGFLLMLLASYLYSLAGFENTYFNASFRALQPIVAAMILRATHKIADHSVRKHNSQKVDPFLIMAAVCTAINGALRINIFMSLGLYGVIYAFVARRLWIPAGALFILQYVGYAIYVVFRSVPSPVSLALGIAKTPSTINLFVLGLVAGSLSFGG